MIMEGCSTEQWTLLDALLRKLVFLKTFKEKKNLLLLTVDSKTAKKEQKV